MAEDYGVSLKITADTSDLDKIPQKVDETKAKIEQPVTQTVEAKVEQPKPVKIEAKAEKVRIEVEDEEAKKRIEALTAQDGVKRIRVVTEGGKLATRQGGKEIFELEVDAKKAKKTIDDLKADNHIKFVVDKPVVSSNDFHVEAKVEPKLDPSELQKIPPIQVPVDPAKVKVDTSDAIGKFNALRAMTAALHGNFTGLSVEIAKLGSGMGALGSIGVGGFFAIGAAIMGVVNTARALRDLFATLFNVGQVGRDITSIGNSIGQIKNQAEQFADAMNDARKASELVNQSLEKEIAALGRVAKAQNEINRQRELSGATSDEERDAINTKYDRQAIDIGANTAQQTEELKRKGIVDEIARLEQEIEQSKKTQASYEEKAAAARERASAYAPKSGQVRAGISDLADSIASSFTGYATINQKSLAASNVATDAQNAADDEAERRAELEERLEKARHDLKNADLEAEARKAEDSAAREKNAQDAATKAAQESERKSKENAEKDRKQQSAQQDYTSERDRRSADAEWNARFRAADDPTKLEMLQKKENAAKAELEAAERELAEEMSKDAKDRDEDRMSRARSRASRAQGEQISAAQQREDLSAQIEDRRAGAVRDYFGNLAREIDASRPQNRLTAMGLGSGGPAESTGREQIAIQKEIARSLREAISAIRANKPGDGTAVYAP